LVVEGLSIPDFYLLRLDFPPLRSSTPFSNVVDNRASRFRSIAPVPSLVPTAVYDVLYLFGRSGGARWRERNDFFLFPPRSPLPTPPTRMILLLFSSGRVCVEAHSCMSCRSERSNPPFPEISLVFPRDDVLCILGLFIELLSSWALLSDFFTRASSPARPQTFPLARDGQR